MHSENTRLGLILFGIYLLFYAGFVILNAVSPASMEWRLLGGLNLAVVYGLALIVVAFVLAIIYGVTAAPTREQGDEQERSP